MIITNENIDAISSLEGFTLLVDKPLTWTSFDVVNKLRYAFKSFYDVRKLKVGHAGTLDPLATGLLIICVGKNTKKIDSYLGLNKTYTGIIRFGGTTESGDLEQEISVNFPTQHINNTNLLEEMQKFKGEISQFPPIYSAIKKDGIPLYKLARAGKKVEVIARKVSIDNFELISYEAPDLSFKVSCSKGTYIRSLAVDLGKKMDSGAHLAKLIRTKIGDHDLRDAWELDTLINTIRSTNSQIETLKE